MSHSKLAILWLYQQWYRPYLSEHSQTLPGSGEATQNKENPFTERYMKVSLFGGEGWIGIPKPHSNSQAYPKIALAIRPYSPNELKEVGINRQSLLPSMNLIRDVEPLSFICVPGRVKNKNPGGRGSDRCKTTISISGFSRSY